MEKYKEAVKEFINNFTNHQIINYEDLVLIKEDIYLPNKEQKEFIKLGNIRGVGTRIGQINKDKFTPSFQLIDLIKTNKIIILNEKMEFLFLCGRDIFKQSVEQKIHGEGLFIIQNKSKENLGIGLIRNKEDKIIKNIIDRGFFLRREKNEKRN